MLSAVCKHSRIGLAVGALFDINEQGKICTLFLAALSLTFLDQCSSEYINICGIVHSGQDRAHWEHRLSKPGDEDHTLVGSFVSNKCHFRWSLDFAVVLWDVRMKIYRDKEVTRNTLLLMVITVYLMLNMTLEFPGRKANNINLKWWILI